MTGLFRVSTSETYRSGIENITDAQALLNRFQDQLATGKRILQPADDPVSSAQVISLQSDLARLVDFQTNTDRASSTLAFAEDAVAGAEDVLRQVRDLVIRSQNPVINAEDRLPLAAEVDGLFQQLLAIGNTKNSDGEFIFGGFESRTQPYVFDGTADTISSPSFGDTGVRDTNIADGIRIPVSDPGTEVFYAAPGNGSFTLSADAGNAGTAVATATRATAGFDQSQDYTLSFAETAPGSGLFTWTVTGSTSGVYTGNYSPDAEIEFGAAGQVGGIKFSGDPSDGDTFNISSNAESAVVANPGNTGTSAVITTRASAAFDNAQSYTLTFNETAVGSGIFNWTVTASGGGGPYTGTYSEGAEIEFGAPGQEGGIRFSGTPANGDSYQIPIGADFRNTNNDSAVRSAFDVLLDIRQALENSNGSANRAIADTQLNQALQDLDQNLAQLQVVRTDAGVRLNRVEDQANLNEAFNLQVRSTVSRLEDIDYAETISQLQLQLVALQAAQQTFVKTTGLTIFNFL